MRLDERIARLRQERLATLGTAIPAVLQGVTKQRVKQVLIALDLGRSDDLVDGVFALLDDQTDSWFPRVLDRTKFCEGATTAHLGCHIGILQRGSGKLDREGRDAWIKPLRQLGGIEPVLLREGQFISGHPVAKSPNSAYRLTSSFRAILTAPENEWPTLLATWSAEDAARERQRVQAALAQESRERLDTGHAALIHACVTQYVARFLPGYDVVYVDDGDGDRITEADKQLLSHAGIELLLGDAMPDVLLWNADSDRLWVIEAVTSDGEVDIHKTQQLTQLATRSGKAGIDFTTAYRTWKKAAARQSTHKNIAVGTYVWIQEDPTKSFYVRAYG